LGNILAAVAYFTIFPHYGWRMLFFVGGLPGLLSLFVLVKVQETEAWHKARTDWHSYKKAIVDNRRLFAYLVGLMAMMNLISHGTQDMYPTFLRLQRGYSVHATALINIVAMTGAIIGGLTVGHLSERLGRKRAMIAAVLLGVLTIPLWIEGSTTALIVIGAFVMQFMVQGAWGVIPAHLNELSPATLRGFFPGFAYQLGVLIASSIGYVEAIIAQHASYAAAMGTLAATVMLVGAAVIAASPESRGIAF
jgi:SHS family lactate transporter-like MFS transporter